MPVIDIRGEAERVSRLLGDLGESIGVIVNPNRELQERVKVAALANPELAAALGSLPKETLEGLGIGRLAPFLAQFPKTPQQVLDDVALGAINKLRESPEAIKDVESFLVAGMLRTTPSQLALEPIRAAAIREAEITEEGRKALGREIITGKTRAEELQETLRSDVISSAINFLNNYVRERELSPREEGILRVAVGTELFAEKDLERKLDFELKLTGARGKKEIDNLVIASKLDTAEWLFRQTGVGNLELWMRWLDNLDLRNTTLKPLTDALKRVEVEKKIPKLVSLSTQLRLLATRINQAAEEKREEDITSYLQLANQHLQSIRLLDIPGLVIPPGISAVYDKLPEEKARVFITGRPTIDAVITSILGARGKKRFHYVDGRGKVYLPELFDSILSGDVKLEAQELETQGPEEFEPTFDASSFEQSLRQLLLRLPEENRRDYVDALIRENATHPNIAQMRDIANKIIGRR